jgi:hypothetical protein
MSDFRTKLLGLAAMGVTFAGLSFGQTTVTCAPTANVPVINATANPTIRAEGETELVADANVTNCIVGTQQTSATVFAALTLPVTSKAISGNQIAALPAPVPPATTVAYTGNSDAVLVVVTTGANGTAFTATQYFPGTVNGTSVTFSMPCTVATVIAANGPTTNNCLLFSAAATSFSVTNIRVNAAGAATPQITETLLLQFAPVLGGAATTNLSSIATNVAYILPSLSYSLPTGFFPFPYTVCAGNTIPAGGTLPPTAAVTLTVKQLVTGAWKVLAAGAGSNAGSEAGSFPANYTLLGVAIVFNAANTPYLVATGIGTATQATDVTVAIANLPASATVYVPQAVTSNGETITLVGAPPVVTAPTGLVGLNGGVVGFTPTNGTVSAVYTPNAAGGGTAFAVPVYIIFSGNTAAVQGAITAAVYYTPAAAVTGPASLIPTFAVNTAAASNLEAIVACNTTLLFPYVTNATGFETGIAIANTTTDNLGVIPGKPSAATPVSGACTLNFYGNMAQPTATTTPTLGAYSSTTPTVVPIYANILTSMVGSSGFSGYAIASCPFQDAHGFAFITDTTGTFSGTEGYLAVVIPATRGENGGTAATATGE